MNEDLRSLYQEIILDHGKHPRNCRIVPDYTHVLEGYNPLCGDQLKLYLKVRNNVIEDVGFTGSGCAISMASASLMSEVVRNKTVEAAETIFRSFHRAVTEDNLREEDKKVLGKLTVLIGVKDYPARVKCATLAWHTMHDALTHKQTPVTTE